MRDTRALGSSQEVAQYLGVTVRTLDHWAYQGTGPRFSKVGRHRRYRWTDIEAWLDRQADQAAA